MYKFQNPHILWKSIDKKSQEFINDQKANEACLISIFAIGYQLLTKANTCDVRLVNDKEPIEAEVRTEKELLGFQITMSLREGRKLKDELLGKRRFESHPPVSFEKFVELIKKLISKKGKKYVSGEGVNLLIYTLIGIEYLFSSRMRESFSKLDTVFDSVWLMSSISTFNQQGPLNGYLIIKISPNATYYDHIAFTDDGIGHNRLPIRYGAIP